MVRMGRARILGAAAQAAVGRFMKNVDSSSNRVSRRRRPRQGGVTLIELLIVVAVLGSLASIVALNILFVANSAKAAAACTDQKTIQTAVAAYFNDTGKYPISTANTGGPSGDAASTTSAGPNNRVDVDELVNPPAPNYQYVHTEPSYTNDGAFTYTDTTGSVAAANAANTC